MSSSIHSRKNKAKHWRLKQTQVTVRYRLCLLLMSGITDKNKGTVDVTVYLSPACDPAAGLEGESLVYAVELQHTIAALPLCGNLLWKSSATEKPVS